MQKSDIVASLRSYPIPWLCGFVSILCAVNLYLTGSAVAELESTRDAMSKEVAVLTNNLREGMDLNDHLERIRAASTKLDNRLIDRDQTAVNVGFFFSFAQNKPVEVTDVLQREAIVEKARPTPAEIWTLANFAVVPFEMKLVGVMNDMMDFLYSLEQSDRIIKVRSFDLARGPSTMESGYMEMNLSLLLLAKTKK
jgi:high-affinity nickel permease